MAQTGYERKTWKARAWVVAAVALMIILAGSGFNQSPSANAQETYRSLKLFSDVLELIEEHYVDGTDPQKLIEDAINGMVSGLDPHSSLLTPDQYEDLKIDTQGEFTGVGIHITLRDGLVTVISPIEGTPAYEAGIKAMDKIVKVDDEPIKDLREAVKKLRGPRGTHVTVTILREGEKEPLTFELIRDVIPVRSIKYSPLKPGYGYIWITNFTGSTTDDFVKALEDLESGPEKLKGLVLDLRDNGGGLLDQSIHISDIFLDEGEILSIKGKEESNNKVYMAKPDRTKREYPIVVLINGGTASASEIVAGALQDHRRALIMGTTSFGKGSVQTVESLRDGYALKLTIARYYTPSGRSIQAKGIEPDIVARHRVLDDEKPEGKNRLLKEKDLENHLEAEPGAGEKTKEQEPATMEGKKPRAHDAEDLIRPLTMESLTRDSQVMQALEILIGYDYFKKAGS